jgi:hypothetical protein
VAVRRACEWAVGAAQRRPVTDVNEVGLMGFAAFANASGLSGGPPSFRCQRETAMERPQGPHITHHAAAVACCSPMRHIRSGLSGGAAALSFVEARERPIYTAMNHRKVVFSASYRGTESLSESGIKWVNGCTKQQCDRTPGGRRHPHVRLDLRCLRPRLSVLGKEVPIISANLSCRGRVVCGVAVRAGPQVGGLARCNDGAPNLTACDWRGGRCVNALQAPPTTTG